MSAPDVLPPNAPEAIAARVADGPVALVCVGGSLQHLTLPFRPDPVFLAGRLVPSFAVALAAVAIYLRTRDLLPLALAHGWIDAATGALTLVPAG